MNSLDRKLIELAEHAIDHSLSYISGEVMIDEQFYALVADRLTELNARVRELEKSRNETKEVILKFWKLP